MANDDLARSLHDKVSRGQTLTAAELTCLEEWYARLDREEAETLTSSPSSAALVSLQAQVQATLTRLQVVTQRIQAQAAENEQLRHEIAELQRQATSPQPGGPT